MKNNDDIKQDIFSAIQTMLNNPPVVIWGSGATIPYGFPSMGILNDNISKEIKDFNGSKNNLEEELGNEKYKYILPKIRKVIWSTIKSVDDNITHKLLDNPSSFEGIHKLINLCIEAHPEVMNIITTNYDRVLENIMSYFGIKFTDGFIGRNLSFFDENLFKDEKIVNLIKVHGSLNWGRFNDEIRYMEINDKVEPVIIPPGKNKYQETYHTPYRELIQYSDKVIKNANSFFVIGFGFNDEHITPEIKNKINKGAPLVLITKSITETTKLELTNAKKYALLEKGQNNKTNVTIKNNDKEKHVILDGNFWDLNKFMEEIL